MANIATVVVNSGKHKRQFGALFSHMWLCTVTISDQDSVALTDTGEFTVTVPGVALGDMVIGWATSSDLSDGTDFGDFVIVVGAADTVDIRLQADAGEYAADDLNGTTLKLIIGRPAW
jgi:hypothetical protein